MHFESKWQKRGQTFILFFAIFMKEHICIQMTEGRRLFSLQRDFGHAYYAYLTQSFAFEPTQCEMIPLQRLHIHRDQL